MTQRTDSDLRAHCRTCAGWFPTSGPHAPGRVCPRCGQDPAGQPRRAWARLGQPLRPAESLTTAQPATVRGYCDSERYLG